MRRRPGFRRGLRRAPGGTERLVALRWIVMGVWFALLIARIVAVAVLPDIDLAVLGGIELAALVAGVIVVAIGFRRAWLARVRQSDDMLALAIRRVDPTVRIVQAIPTDELRDDVRASHPDVELTDRVTWGFGATEASLWQLDGRRAVRVLVIRWSRVVHVTLESGAVAGSAAADLVAMHYVRPDDSAAIATFAVRIGPGRGKVLGRGPRLERLVHDLAAERILV
jgi:hypothetical protein